MNILRITTASTLIDPNSRILCSRYQQKDVTTFYPKRSWKRPLGKYLIISAACSAGVMVAVWAVLL